MAITRRTPRFAVVAEAAEAETARRGVTGNLSVAVDAAINMRIQAVAELMGLSPRAALGYMPADLWSSIADDVEAASQL